MSTRTRPEGCCTIPNRPIPFTDTDRMRLVSIFKALGDRTRLDIYRLIAAQDASICVCDVTERFEVSQPTISHHLKVLRDAELVTTSRRGVWAYYEADPQGLAFLRGSLDAFALVAETPQETMTLSAQDSAAFVEALETPPAPGERLRDAARARYELSED